jgi:hypothetical protein
MYMCNLQHPVKALQLFVHVLSCDMTIFECFKSYKLSVLFRKSGFAYAVKTLLRENSGVEN